MAMSLVYLDIPIFSSNKDICISFLPKIQERGGDWNQYMSTRCSFDILQDMFKAGDVEGGTFTSCFGINKPSNAPKHNMDKGSKRNEKERKSKAKVKECGERTLDKCESCGTSGKRLKVCEGCNLAIYCSVECQETAWKSHQRICNIISHLPACDSDKLVLKYDGENHAKTNDFDASLRYATKYMDNLKHVEVVVPWRTKENEKLKLSKKKVSSLFKSTAGSLDSLLWSGSETVGVTDDTLVWMDLFDLKQLRLEEMEWNDIQGVYNLISQQKKRLEVLSLTELRINWLSNARVLALSISFCTKLVRLELSEASLIDSDVEIMLYNLPLLKNLHLANGLDRRSVTNKTCELIATKCPNLQALRLKYFPAITYTGITTIFESCQHLRFFSTSFDLNVSEVKTLLGLAPQLMCLSLNEDIEISDVEFVEIIESIGCRSVITFYDHYEPAWDIPGLSPTCQEKYKHQRELFDNISGKRKDPTVSNEWEDLFGVATNVCEEAKDGEKIGVREMTSMVNAEWKAKKEAKTKMTAHESDARELLAAEVRNAFISKKRQELIDTTDTREWTLEFLESLTDEDIINLDDDTKAKYENLPTPESLPADKVKSAIKMIQALEQILPPECVPTWN